MTTTANARNRIERRLQAFMDRADARLEAERKRYMREGPKVRWDVTREVVFTAAIGGVGAPL